MGKNEFIKAAWEVIPATLYELAEEVISREEEGLKEAAEIEDQGERQEAIFELILQGIDDSVIYYSQQWDVMAAYQNPAEADFAEAIEAFRDDIVTTVNRLFGIE